MKKSVLFAVLVLAIPFSMLAQNTRKRVLMLGNSYTSRNDLPLIISNIASSMRDTLLVDSHAPSAHTLVLHTRDATTLSKIAAGNWDFVVLQEQSQRPALDINEVESRFFAPVKTLDNLVNQSNACGETMLYVTWGRKNGDSENCGAFPPICTYEGMDSLLQLRNRMAADSNKAVLSPVGAVWRHIRRQYPNIELYNADESHPSVSGSYAAALCFYTCIFRKNPTLVSFNNGLTATEANNIKMAVKTVVFDRLAEWRIGTYDPKAAFTANVSANNSVSFTNRSANATTYFWEFGDGNTSTSINPTHTYATSGSYNVRLRANRCRETNTLTQAVNSGVTSVQDQALDDIKMFPNPVSAQLVLENAKFDKLFIVNNLGQVQITTLTPSDQKTLIDVSGLSTGLYWLVLMRDGHRATYKIVKI